MPIARQLLDCSVAGKRVVVRFEMAMSCPDSPPVMEFVSCDGMTTCGMRQNRADGSPFDESLCPVIDRQAKKHRCEISE